MSDTLTSNSSLFKSAAELPWATVAEGVRRQILTHDDQLMVVKVAFDRGTSVPSHQHVHVQMSYVESGAFTVTIADETQVLRAGDAFHIPSNVWHGVECLEAGVIVDAFNPVRQDFL
jgi:quercetin dioxygenase-like cupin family protein